MKRLVILLMILLIFTGCSENQTALKSQQAEPTKVIEKSHIKDTTSTATIEKDNNSHDVQNSNNLNNNDTSTPVLIKGFLLGGLSKGVWLSSSEFYNSKIVNLDAFKYDVYKNDKMAGTAYGSLPTDPLSGGILKEDKYVEDFSVVNLYDKENKKIDYDIAIKADWDLFPRKYINQSTKQKTYDTLVKNILEEAGLVRPVSSLKQVIRVDLDGDGTEEVLISADNTVNDQYNQVKKGDNSIVIFRKIVDGTVIDNVVEEDIRLKDEDSIYRLLFRIETVADLDGDGIMEVIIRHWYYEGESWGIYKLKDNKLVMIATNGFGV